MCELVGVVAVPKHYASSPLLSQSRTTLRHVTRHTVTHCPYALGVGPCLPVVRLARVRNPCPGDWLAC